jgi:hypothetical protein
MGRDPDIVDRAAKIILETRAPGLGKREWARKAAIGVLGLTETAPSKPRKVNRHGLSPVRGSKDEPIVHVRPRQCEGWIGTFDDGSLRIGVTKDTEAETRAGLDAAVVRWRQILALPDIETKGSDHAG